MSERIRLGISTCPNDTFAFHALLAREVDWRGLRFEVELADVEQLNERMLAGSLDVAKVSFHAALAMAERVGVLSSGSALGFGVGPLLLGAPGRIRPADTPAARVLCPGEWTTATLLWKLFHAGEGELEQRPFSEIMPALASGEADFGVCIHEGRFTWRDHGLAFVEDLGETWERETGAALPLGGIVAAKRLGLERIGRVQDAIRASLEWAGEHRAACLPTMRAHAQELEDAVLWAHVDLYVNARTLELGEVGRGALDALSELACARGLLPAGTARLAIL